MIHSLTIVKQYKEKFYKWLNLSPWQSNVLRGPSLIVSSAGDPLMRQAGLFVQRGIYIDAVVVTDAASWQTDLFMWPSCVYFVSQLLFNDSGIIRWALSNVFPWDRGLKTPALTIGLQCARSDTLSIKGSCFYIKCGYTQFLWAEIISCWIV